MNDEGAEISELSRLIRTVTTKEEACAVVEARAHCYAAREPRFELEWYRTQTLELIGFMTGSLERDEANRMLDLFETEHPWLDREGNTLPKKRKYGESRRARPLVVLKRLVRACKTKEEAHALVEEEAANMVADDHSPFLELDTFRKLFLDGIRFDIRYMDDVEEVARLTELFELNGDGLRKTA